MSGAEAAIEGDASVSVLPSSNNLLSCSSNYANKSTMPHDELQMGVEERKNVRVTSSRGKDYTHYDCFLLMLNERKSWHPT